jgi:hypothetical protein
MECAVSLGMEILLNPTVVIPAYAGMTTQRFGIYLILVP